MSDQGIFQALSLGAEIVKAEPVLSWDILNTAADILATLHGRGRADPARKESLLTETLELGMISETYYDALVRLSNVGISASLPSKEKDGSRDFALLINPAADPAGHDPLKVSAEIGSLRQHAEAIIAAAKRVAASPLGAELRRLTRKYPPLG